MMESERKAEEDGDRDIEQQRQRDREIETETQRQRRRDGDAESPDLATAGSEQVAGCRASGAGCTHFSVKPDSGKFREETPEGVLGVLRETVCRYLSARLKSKRSALSFR